MFTSLQGRAWRRHDLCRRHSRLDHHSQRCGYPHRRRTSTYYSFLPNPSNFLSTQKTTYIWQIGDFDGTPSGFLNADKIETMHPSDSRMSNWGPITFTVGSSISSFPMALFKAVGTVTIKSTLSSSQIGARTLKIATTLAFAGGRPSVTVNGATTTNPGAPTQPDSRGVTRGTYRGNNIEYTYAIRECCFVGFWFDGC